MRDSRLPWRKWLSLALLLFSASAYVLLPGAAAEDAAGLGAKEVAYRSLADGADDATLNEVLAGHTARQFVNDADTRAPAAKVLTVNAETHPVTVLNVLVMTFFMGAAAGLGAVPYLFFDKLSKLWAGLANAVACGVMVAAAFDLVHDGEEYGGASVILGVVVGCLFIKYMQEYLHRFEDVKFEGLVGGSARKALLVVSIMAAHAIGEGAGVGVSYSGQRGWAHGVLVTLAIGFHNIPEGLAVATVMVAKGASTRSAMWWATMSSMPQPLFAVPSFVFVEWFRACLPFAMGFAAGSMVWIVFAELLPDALEDVPAGPVASAATMSAAWLEGLRITLAHLEQPNGELSAHVSGDMHVIVPAIASSFVSVAFVAVSAFAASTVIHGLSPMALGASVGAQITLAGFAALALFRSQQPILVTVTLMLLGALLTWALWHHQYKALQESLRIVNASLNEAMAAELPVSTADIENGNGSHPSSDSWEMMSEGGKGGMKPDWQEGGSLKGKPPGPPHIAFTTHNLTIPPSKGFRGLPSWSVASISALLCLIALTGHQVVEGWKAAQVAVTAPADAVTRLMLPMTVNVVAVAVAVVGLSPLLIGAGRRRHVVLASLIASFAPIALSIALLRYPTGVHTPKEVAFDPNDWIDRGSALVGGGGLTAAGWALWPHVRTHHASNAAAGAVVGVFVTAAMAAASGLLCLATPYCLVPDLST